MGCFPLVATLSWANCVCLLLVGTCLADHEGGLSAIFGIIFILWLIVNLGTFLYDPKNYLVWKRGGGDPFFDTLHWPFNTDDDASDMPNFTGNERGWNSDNQTCPTRFDTNHRRSELSCKGENHVRPCLAHF